MENKTSKYFKYAIGEIILVVIGILIALQLNNWNEQRKASQAEKNLLIGLQNEFKLNLEKIDGSVELNQTNIDACFRITEMIRDNTLEKQTVKLDSLLGRLGVISSFDARRAVTDEIINSGKLDILKNDALRVLITRWPAELEEAREDIGFTVMNYNNNLMPFLIDNFPLANAEITKKWENDNIKMYSNPSSFSTNFSELNTMKFESVIWHHKHNIDFILGNDYDLKETIKTIINAIENALADKN
ncbi:DUF6090 family protein [Winogradskyella sp. A3E31]|uniref:DUF6090 family protein n=1 Tax=Winogradskyella sp. A3E31 TaxID=3349637 RepID=UPI00398BB726